MNNIITVEELSEPVPKAEEPIEASKEVTMVAAKQKSTEPVTIPLSKDTATTKDTFQETVDNTDTAADSTLVGHSRQVSLEASKSEITQTDETDDTTTEADTVVASNMVRNGTTKSANVQASSERELQEQEQEQEQEQDQDQANNNQATSIEQGHRKEEHQDGALAWVTSVIARFFRGIARLFKGSS